MKQVNRYPGHRYWTHVTECRESGVPSVHETLVCPRNLTKLSRLSGLPDGTLPKRDRRLFALTAPRDQTEDPLDARGEDCQTPGCDL